MQNSIIILRILYSVVLLGSIVFLPGYVVMVGIIIGFFLFPKYIEGIVVALFLDGMFSFTGSTPHAGVYILVSFSIYISSIYLKKHLTWYS